MFDSVLLPHVGLCVSSSTLHMWVSCGLRAEECRGQWPVTWSPHINWLAMRSALINGKSCSHLSVQGKHIQVSQWFFIFIFNSLHVSNTMCSSSGEMNCVNTTSGNRHSVSCAGQTLPTYTQHSHWQRVTVSRGCIDTICLSWWWARCARNM
jgi:hypothetical protein